MKHNWEYKQLGEIGVILTGSTPSTSVKEYYDQSDYMFVKPGDIEESGITYLKASETYISELAFNTASRKLPKHSILVTCIGTIGKVGILQQEATCNQQINAIIPAADNIYYKYLAYAISSIKSFLISKKNGPVVPIINKTQFSKFKIPVPPMEVQERIVAELDKINETIGDCRELLRNLDALKLSLFYDYFGDPNTNPKNWNISTFGEIGTFIRGGGFLKRDFVDFGIPCIHYGQIHTKFGEVVRKNLTYISEYTALKSKFAKPNDVILAITSEDLEGSCKSVAWLGDFEVAVGGHAAIFTHNQNPVFISFYTRSNAFCIEKEKYAHGSKVVEIRPKDIEKIPIYLPPLELQKKFAERIEQIEAQKKTVENTIAELQTLLDSRMDYWFN